MKVLNKNKKKKRIIFIIIIVAIFLLCALICFYSYKNNQSTISNSGKSKTTSSNSSSQSKTSNQNSSSSTAQTKTDEPIVISNNTSITIVDASQYSDMFEVRSYVTAISDGTCTYTFTKDSTTITKTSDAVAGPSSTTCKTLDVSISEFTSSGAWSMTISYQSSDGQYSANTKSDIEIK